jgi:predicted peptidase
LPQASNAVAPNPHDPLYQTKGDNIRAYAFPGTGEIIPYRLFVPSKWTKDTKLPLMVILHSGNSVNVPFERGDGVLAKVAEQRGYIVLAPQGYSTGPRFNSPYDRVSGPPSENASNRAVPPTPPTARGGKWGEQSEMDVLYATDLVAQEYNVDRSRIYLFSNSVGGAGVWYLGEKYPQRWASIAVASAPIVPDRYPFDRLKATSLLVVQGEDEGPYMVSAAKKMVDLAKEHGVDAQWMPVTGGDHLEAWTKVFPQMLDFFDAHKRK